MSLLSPPITDLTTNARSTLEQFRAPMFENNKTDQDGWSLGRMNNMREVVWIL
jgi:hypothetical protein